MTPTNGQHIEATEDAHVEASFEEAVQVVARLLRESYGWNGTVAYSEIRARNICYALGLDGLYRERLRLLMSLEPST